MDCEEHKTRAKRGRKKGGICKYPALQADAIALGCSASYLWKCLTGREPGQKLIPKYRQMKEAQRRIAGNPPSQQPDQSAP